MKIYRGSLALIVQRIGCAGLLCAMGAAQLCSAAKPDGPTAGNGWHVIAHYKLDGTGSPGNAAIDTSARRLYVAHGNTIEVLNADSGVKAGEIACGSRIFGVAIAAKLKRGFASDANNSITIFSTDSMKVLEVVPSGGKGPDAVLYDDGNQRVYVANSASGSVTAIDAASGKFPGRRR
jgi:DNA-binding beta-propeller fold protein YncE